MKNKPSELDVDFIGGQSPLTKAEEKAISDFIKAQKLIRAKAQIGKKKKVQRAKVAPPIFNIDVKKLFHHKS